MNIVKLNYFLKRMNFLNLFRNVLFLSLITILINDLHASEKIKSVHGGGVRNFESFSVDSVAKGPLQIILSVYLEDTPENVWKLIGNHTRVGEWAPTVDSNHVLESNSDNRSFNVILSRQCSLDGDKLTEDIAYDNKKNIVAFSINKERSNVSVPIKNHLGVMTVEPYKNGTLFVWRQYWDKGLAGKIASRFLKNKYMIPAMNKLIEKYGGEIVEVEK